MRVRCHHQPPRARHRREAEGVVHHDQRRRALRHAGQRAHRVGVARRVVADADHPELVAGQLHRGVLQHADALRGQGLDGALAVVPPVVIAEHRVHALRRLEAAEHGGHAFDGERLVVAGAREEVAGQQHHIGLCGVDGIDDARGPLDAGDAPCRARGQVPVASHGHLEARGRLPLRRAQGLDARSHPTRLDDEAPERKRRQHECGGDPAPATPAARAHASAR